MLDLVRNNIKLYGNNFVNSRNDPGAPAQRTIRKGYSSWVVWEGTQTRHRFQAQGEKTKGCAKFRGDLGWKRSVHKPTPITSQQSQKRRYHHQWTKSTTTELTTSPKRNSGWAWSSREHAKGYTQTDDSDGVWKEAEAVAVEFNSHGWIKGYGGKSTKRYSWVRGTTS